MNTNNDVDNSDADISDEDVKNSSVVDKMVSEMTNEQRTRFDIFQKTCKFSQNRIKEMMENVVPGTKVQQKSAFVASLAVRLFAAELIELARDLSGNDEPLTQDLIMIALNEIIEKGTIPGKGPGIKRSQVF